MSLYPPNSPVAVRSQNPRCKLFFYKPIVVRKWGVMYILISLPLFCIHVDACAVHVCVYNKKPCDSETYLYY